MKYNLSTKRKDTGKYWSFGNMKQGDPEYKAKYNIGIRVTPEFMALVNEAGEGGWINLNAYEDDGEKRSGKPNASTQAFIDSQSEEVPW